MFVRSRILNVLAFGCSLAALLCPWYVAGPLHCKTPRAAPATPFRPWDTRLQQWCTVLPESCFGVRRRYRACGKANGPCNNLAILRVRAYVEPSLANLEECRNDMGRWTPLRHLLVQVGKSTGFISPALAALVVPGLVAALIDIVFIRWYKRAGALVFHTCCCYDRKPRA